MLQEKPPQKMESVEWFFYKYNSVEFSRMAPGSDVDSLVHEFVMRLDGVSPKYSTDPAMVGCLVNKLSELCPGFFHWRNEHTGDHCIKSGDGYASEFQYDKIFSMALCRVLLAVAWSDIRRRKTR